MEPNPSGYYPDPVVVLDFQSLYPSMIIAYNLCYSTIIGKLKLGTPDVNNPTAEDTTGRLGTEVYPEAYAAMASYYNTIPSSSSSTSSCSTSSGTNSPFLAPNGSLFCNKHTRLGMYICIYVKWMNCVYESFYRFYI